MLDIFGNVFVDILFVFLFNFLRIFILNFVRNYFSGVLLLNLILSKFFFVFDVLNNFLIG